MDKKIGFICPYFGKFSKGQFEKWLLSCKYNSAYDWLVYTDDTSPYNYPPNVHVTYIQFSELREKIQNIFKFKICLDNAYKLCDYKPVYGHIFEDDLKQYEFWGYCDISDCIFGNISYYLNDEILNKYDKINYLGHMTLYRNYFENNRRYQKINKLGRSLNSIFATKENMAFDESQEYGINKIFEIENILCTRIDDMYADISPLRYAFQLIKSDNNYNFYKCKKYPMVFEWNKGHLKQLTLISEKITVKEVGYVHFQKRKMIDEVVNNEHYYIVPWGFINCIDGINECQIKNFSREKMFYIPFFKLKIKAFKTKIKRWVKNGYS